MSGRPLRYAKPVDTLAVGRGLAIVSVIYGHALAPWVFGAGEDFSSLAFIQWKFGASFMMPFFFFLSGVGWRDDKSLGNTTRQALALILIALLASIAYDATRAAATLAGLDVLVGAQPVRIADLITSAARMTLLMDHYSFTALWFLTALALVRLLGAVSVRLSVAARVCLAIMLLLATFASTQFGWGNYFQLHVLGLAFVFFMAGHAARALFRQIEQRPGAAYALLLLGGALTFATFHLNEGCRWDPLARCGQPWLNGHFGVTMIRGQFGNLLLFAVTSICGIAFASGLSMLVARLGGASARWLDAWGGNSLNLLIVNCLFLHVGNALIYRFITPHVAADDVLFFVVLLSATLIANILAAHALERPLRRLHRLSRWIAGRLIEGAAAAPGVPIWGLRADRVSQRNE